MSLESLSSELLSLIAMNLEPEAFYNLAKTNKRMLPNSC